MIPTEVTWDDLAMFGCESREVFNGLSPIERQQVLMASAMYRGVWPPPFPEGVTANDLVECAYKEHLGKRLDDILENTVIEQHRSLKGVRDNEGTDVKPKTEYVFIFEDGARVIVK